MNNRFRFRLWDNDNECYDYIDFRELSRTNEILATYEEYFYDGYFERNQDCIEQCTGLKDENGNLIYEGDILRTYDEDWVIVEWADCGFKALIDDTYYDLDDIVDKYTQIISNIHEQKDNK